MTSGVFYAQRKRHPTSFFSKLPSMPRVATLSRDPAVPLATNPHLLRWVDKMRELMRPAAIHWVDGSEEEYDLLCAQMVRDGGLPTLLAEWATHIRGRWATPVPTRTSSARCPRTGA